MSRLIACLLGGACLIVPAEAQAAKGSLYSGPGPQPGPRILYQQPTTAPQLRNAGPWEAKPLLVSGASAYRRGEFLYQDFIYDDSGAAGDPDPGDPRAGNIFSRPSGTYTYPTDPAYAENAADLVELRVKPLRRSTAFRITLNSLLDPALVGATIALGESAEPLPLPARGRGERAGGVLPHRARRRGGPGAGRRRSGDRARAASPGRPRRRNQIEVRVARARLGPGRRAGPAGRRRRALGPGGRRLPDARRRRATATAPAAPAGSTTRPRSSTPPSASPSRFRVRPTRRPRRPGVVARRRPGRGAARAATSARFTRSSTSPSCGEGGPT